MPHKKITILVPNYKTEELTKLCLRLIRKKTDLSKCFLNQNWVKKSGCIILISAVFKRNTIKYGDRGYRHIMQEAGHLGQNIYLISSALGLGCCAISGFNDEELNNMLDLDGVNEGVIYSFSIGSKNT